MNSIFSWQFGNFRKPDPAEKQYIETFYTPQMSKMFWGKSLQKLMCYAVGLFLITAAICGSFFLMNGNLSWGLLVSFPIILITDHALTKMSFDIIRSAIIYLRMKKGKYLITESSITKEMFTQPEEKIWDIFVFQKEEPIFVMTIAIPENKE